MIYEEQCITKTTKTVQLKLIHTMIYEEQYTLQVINIKRITIFVLNQFCETVRPNPHHITEFITENLTHYK